MSSDSPDPTVVCSIAVTSGDVVAALEINRTGDDHATLRITPPFSARMRARLHVDRSRETDPRTESTDGSDTADRAGGNQGPQVDSQLTADGDGDRTVTPDGQHAAGGTGPASNNNGGEGVGPEEPVYIDPDRLVADPPAYPRPADTREELLSDPETTYTVERHHEYHAAAVQRWRESVPDSIRDSVTLDTSAGSREVRVRTLDADML